MTQGRGVEVTREMEAVELAALMQLPYNAGGVYDQPTWFIKTYLLKQKIIQSAREQTYGN